ncbi:FAD/NAD(P)-binding domain-containing protein [Lojkania enalia]|uniref:FAD/NAD(P)-binding domain-containing protein n=1 Tax=Lojkania enalia TaxID=147567 RepID=A0A9P4NAV0_9PLEO|nr:FAD/NAD(P)-binding domain-containing protein [Didymosphaeria enalia]
MEETQVVIVGAGPSGLALALSLAKFQVHSVVLEKEREVTADPRGVYLTGDAIRIFWDLGIGPDLPDIGHEVKEILFHQSTFVAKPFFSLCLEKDLLSQALPTGVLQMQPKLENALRRQVQLSEWCTLHTGCTVVKLDDDSKPRVEYLDENGIRRQITGHWLVGADGKLGIVRKHFLEPTAGVKQEEGVYRYSGTWIAANLKIRAPTPETHPEFPLWSLGYSSDEVYDLYWPKGWHFCSPPGEATASGRFGPHSERVWRHEFRLDAWEDSMDAEALLWDHITPMITRQKDPSGRKFHNPVQFPRDCVEILRCRPFSFTHKVVNKWFYKRIILIGDAAHVFPPFAGQGIASGVRDAHQLAWRLAILVDPLRGKKTDPSSILEAWACERRRSVDDAALFSWINGRLVNQRTSIFLRIVLRVLMFVQSVPFPPRLPDIQTWKEREGFSKVDGGFFLKQYNGGVRLAQVLVQSPKQSRLLSDCLLRQTHSVFTLLLLSRRNYIGMCEDAREAIQKASISPSILSQDSIVVVNPDVVEATSTPSIQHDSDPIELFSLVSRDELPGHKQLDYSECSYLSRLGRSTMFVIARPDFYTFACAKDLSELVTCLSLLRKRLE